MRAPAGGAAPAASRTRMATRSTNRADRRPTAHPQTRAEPQPGVESPFIRIRPQAKPTSPDRGEPLPPLQRTGERGGEPRLELAAPAPSGGRGRQQYGLFPRLHKTCSSEMN